MSGAPHFQADSNRFAVIRKFEPTRIERELLAQVFEVISQRRGHRGGEFDHDGASVSSGISQVATGTRVERDILAVGVAPCDSLEPAA